uniref:LITAF domain-containing protein n=1 Tax=Parascaris equorum TaxID=6256 RepID=A0A914S607_PAREQ
MGVSEEDRKPVLKESETPKYSSKCTSDPLPQQTSNVAAFATPVVNGNPSGSYLDPLDYRFECPECQKT